MSPYLYILIAFILIPQAIWIFLDARKRGEAYWLWGLFGLLHAPGSLIIYLLATKKRRINCPDCGEILRNSDPHCPKCGKLMICPECNEQIQENWVYCPFCSHKLSD